MNRKSYIFFIFLCTCFAFSCKKSISTQQVKPVTEAEITNYFSLAWDNVRPSDAPEGLYHKVFDIKNLNKEKETLWNLWCKTHKDKIEPSELFGLTKVYKEPVWDIPEGEKMKLYVFAKGEKPADGYPMIINLHGGGMYPQEKEPWGSNINSREFQTAYYLAYSVYKENTPVIYFIPRMPDDRKGRWYFEPKRIAFRRAFQIGVLSGLVNPNKVYVMGISEGGYGSLRLGLFMPDYFGGVGPMAGAEFVGEHAKNLRNVAFRMEVGEHDYAYSRSDFARKWKSELARLHQDSPEDFIHEVNIQEGRDHSIDYTLVSPWLVRQTRRTYPKRITYEYYDLDGKNSYSPAVYYLGFKNLSPEKGSSMTFDVKHSGNEFILETKKGAGNTKGSFDLYIDKVDFTLPVKISYNGKVIFNQKITLNKGIIAESIALFGDPERIFAAKITIPLD